MERRLAAILAADVVGYSRLIRADEEGTLAALKARRADLIDPTIAVHHGRIVKLMGDGMLVEFASVVDAVRAATEIQQAVVEHHTDIPAERSITLRIGINLGDVVIDGDDIHGDGVNVASRLEGLAEPGGICVSGGVYEQVRDRLDHAFVDQGEQTVKNIDRPVRVWSWGVAAMPKSAGNGTQAVPDRPSVAVLPFDKMSGDPEQSYFADGMTEDIITDLSKISGLFVIARNSSFAYKGRSPDVRQVCRELGVRYILKGSVRKAGTRVPINAQMIDGTTGGHLWAERYDRDLEDIFAVQDEVTRSIVEALKVKLTTGEKTRLEGRGKVDPAAYECLMRGRAFLLQFTAEATAESRVIVERAIELDPDMALGYSAMAFICCTDYMNGWNDAGPDSLRRAMELAQTACAKDPNEPQAYQALALVQSGLRRLDEAESAAERVLELDPNYAGGYNMLATVHDYTGRHESAADLLEHALRLDPQFDLTLQFLRRAQFSQKQYEKAEENFRRRLIHRPRSDMTRVFLAPIYGHTGRHEEARQMWRELKDINPEFSLDHYRSILPYRDPAWFEHFEDGLAKDGLPAWRTRPFLCALGEPMIIHGDVRSGNCLKVSYTADYLGMPYRWVDVDFMRGECRAPAYLARNPQGQVPMVEFDDGRCLAQSNAIIRYLARGSTLLPADPFAQAKADEWLFWEQYSHEPNIAVCCFHMLILRRSKAEREPRRVERGEAALELMERLLDDRNWFAGSTFSVADTALVAYTRLAGEGGFDFAARPNVKAWIARCEGELKLAA